MSDNIISVKITDPFIKEKAEVIADIIMDSLFGKECSCFYCKSYNDSINSLL